MPRGREDVTRQIPAKTGQNGRQTSPKRPARPAPSNGNVRPVQPPKKSRAHKSRSLPRPRLGPFWALFTSQFKRRAAKRVKPVELEDSPIIETKLLSEATESVTTLPKPNAFKRFGTRLRKKPEKAEKPKKVRRVWPSTAVKAVLLIALVILLPRAVISSFRQSSVIQQETQDRKASDTHLQTQITDLGGTSFPAMADAVAKAQRLAYDCFTVPSTGTSSQNDDTVGAQNKALAYDGIPAGDKLNCGWDGKGRGKLDETQVVPIRYWEHSNRATVILQIKLYQRLGSFYYYVPFTNDHGVARFAGMPAIFGTGSGAMDFLSSCDDPVDSASTNQMQQTAQLFLNDLAGDNNVPLGYLVYGNANFGGFGRTVSSPKISQVMYCGSQGQEKLFAALVTFNGPVQGAHYTLPYAFEVVPNPETNGKYQIKKFGPAPGYTGN
jgi:hypothetical protein